MALSIAMTVCSTTMALFMLPLLLMIYTPSLIDSVNVEATARCVSELAKPTMQALFDRPGSTSIINYCWESRAGEPLEDACHAAWVGCGGALTNSASARAPRSVSGADCTHGDDGDHGDDNDGVGSGQEHPIGDPTPLNVL